MFFYPQGTKRAFDSSSSFGTIFKFCKGFYVFKLLHTFLQEDNEKQLNRKNKVESIAQKLAGNNSLRKQNIQDIFMEAKEENR